MYDPWRFNLAEHLRKPAEHPIGPDDGGQLVGRLDAVQERQHHGVLAEQRSHRRRDLRYLPRLHRHHHEIDRADLGRIVGCCRRGEMRVAERAVYLQAALADCLEVRTAGDERDIVAGAREPCPVVAAETTGAVDCDPHPRLPIHDVI